MSDRTNNKWAQVAFDCAAGLVLFAGTVAVVWWQNTRLTVLYDLCGVLENATRMAQGDMPYRDFPFPYAPLTFLTQATIIKLTGIVYWHHIVYCCIIGGLATLAAWRILVNLFRDTLPRPHLTAFLLSLPLVVLGVYCIFPHPFYDPDTAFVVLLCILFLLYVERKDFPPIRTFLVGVLLVVPLFVKQNIGLTFLGSIGLWLLAMLFVNLWKKSPVRPFLVLLGGSTVGVALALALIHFTFGIDNYKQWTFTYATARRTPSFSDMLSVYQDWMLTLWVGIFLLGAFLMRQDARVKRWPSIISVLLMAAPFMWPVVYLLVNADASERAERLVGLWPFVFIVSLGLSYLFIRRLNGIAAALPFILTCTAHGVFLSQQLWGSTYAIWPLLIILFALVLRLLYDPENERPGVAFTALTAIISLTLIVAGGFYVYSNERLDYVNFQDGEMAHSTLPQLKGLSMRGSYIPDFEELVKYTDANIPRDDGILLLPGEDLFYYTTGRHPHFSVLLFDVTNNPYNADEIHERVMAGDLVWLIVKNDLQIEADDMIDSKDRILEALKPDFRHIESLNNYEIFKRRMPGDPPDDEGDDSDDGDDGSDTADSNSGK